MRIALRWWFLVLAVATMVVAACEGDDETPTPSASPTATMTAIATATPVATEEPEPPALATVDPSTIPGITTRTDSYQGPPRMYFTTYPEIAGFPLLGETMAAEVAAERTAFDAVAPESSGPIQVSLNVSFEVLVASGDVIGVKLLTYQFFGANGADLARTVWFDLASGEALPAAGLLDGEAGLRAVADLARDALVADYGDLLFMDTLDDALAPDAEHFPTMGFDAAGDLVIEFDEYAVGPGALGRLAIVLPAADVEPHLSDLGQRARAETLSPSGPLVLPTPTPEVAVPTPAPPAAGNTDCAATPCVALTFDDGPAGQTPRLLDLLADRGVRVTFFVVGIGVQVQPGVVARAHAEGHEIGNHTFDHRDLTTLGREGIREEIESSADLIEAATGVRPVLVRPPYGAIDDEVREEAGAPLVLWSVDPRDWADRDPAIVTQRVLETARAGDIVLMHDIHATSVDAVPAIVDGLRERGFALVTVSELLGAPLAGGETYRRR